MKNHSTQGRTSKYSLLLVLVILVSLSLLTFTACDGQSDVSSISVIEESIPQDKKVSEFDITEVTLETIDSEGKKSTMNATPVMLTTESRTRLTQGGTQDITLRYQQKTTTFTVKLFDDDAELVNVTFKDYHGNVIDTLVTEKGGEIESPPPHPVREGYIADGWVRDNSNEKVDLDSVQQSIDVYANYKENIIEHTVTFTDYKDNIIGSVEVSHGDKIHEIVSYDKPEEVEDYYWYYGNSELNIEELTVTQNITITMKVDYLRHKVTYQFIDNNSNTILLDEESVRHGSAATEATDAIDTLYSMGYNFHGWDKEIDNIKSELTVTADASIFSYTVEFISHNNVDYAEVNHGDDVSPPTPATKPGYMFDHWEGGSLENITEERVFTAVYNPRSYTITLVDDGVEENITMYFNEVITAENLNDLKDKGEDDILLGIY
ncbi:MAG: InlB B-repeat-containing protein, partial [Bacillota bacterium]